jgi:hypothetical protein
MSTTGEQDHYSTEQGVFRLFIVPLRLGRNRFHFHFLNCNASVPESEPDKKTTGIRGSHKPWAGIMIEIGYGCEIYVIIHEVRCRTELTLSARRDRRSTDILHKSFQKCSRGLDRKPRPGVELTHISIWHSEAVRRRWLGIAVHVSSISIQYQHPVSVRWSIHRRRSLPFPIWSTC